MHALFVCLDLNSTLRCSQDFEAARKKALAVGAKKFFLEVGRRAVRAFCSWTLRLTLV